MKNTTHYVTEQDFDFMKKSTTSFKEDSLILEYLGIFCSIAFVYFLFQYFSIHITFSFDINFAFDNLLNPHSLIFKHKLY